MTDASFSKRISFAYLEDLKENFNKKFDKNMIENAITYSLNNPFYNTIKQKTVKYLKKGFL